jgi:short-subunit dehydrogenase
VILITGASSGIGLVTAKRAAAAGAKVVLVARDADALVTIVREIEEAGGKATFASADVGDLRDLQRAATKAVETFGRIDTWVNDAGVAIYAKLVDTPMREHEELFGTNYFGVVNGSLTAVEQLQREGGALINVASIAADIPTPIMGAYAASKHAVKAYTQSLRMELIADKIPISVTLIKPGGIDTPIAQHAYNNVDGEALIPPPVYSPELVADAILDAAVNPRRDVTVGGGARLQVLVGTHFPKLLDAMGAVVTPLVEDTGVPKTPGDNLAASRDTGHETSRTQHGRSFSVYGTPRRRNWLGAIAVAGAVVGAIGFGLRGGSDTKPGKARKKS